MEETTLSLFQSIGLSEAKAKDTIKNAAVSSALKSHIFEVLADNCYIIRLAIVVRDLPVFLGTE